MTQQAFELLFSDQLLLEKLFHVMLITKASMRVPILCVQIMKSIDEDAMKSINVEASSGNALLPLFESLVCFLVK